MATVSVRAVTSRWRSNVMAIATHEIRGLWRDGRVRIAVATCLVLQLVAGMSGYEYQKSVAAERKRAGEIERGRWISQGAKNPHDAAHYGVYVFKPESPLALFDRGIDPFVGVGVWLEAHKMNNFVYRPAQDEIIVNRFGDLSAAAIAQLLLPLMIVLIGYGSLSGERERGTFRQLLMSGCNHWSIGFGKAFASSLVIAAVLVPTFVIGILGAAAEPASRFARVASLYAAYAAYFFGWIWLTLAVSAMSRTRRASLVALVGLWTAGCVIGPRLASEVVGQVRPLPTEPAFRAALDRELGASHSSERAQLVKERLLREYDVATTADLPFDWRGVSLQEGEEHGNRVFDRHFGMLFSQYEAQSRLLHEIGALVPLLSIRAVSQWATGTDFEHHRRFLSAAESHRRVIQRLLNEDVRQHDRENTDYVASADFWRTIPEFVYQSPTLSETLPHVTPALGALVLWLLTTTSVALVCVARLRV